MENMQHSLYLDLTISFGGCFPLLGGLRRFVHCFILCWDRCCPNLDRTIRWCTCQLYPKHEYHHEYYSTKQHTYSPFGSTAIDSTEPLWPLHSNKHCCVPSTFEYYNGVNPYSRQGWWRNTNYLPSKNTVIKGTRVCDYLFRRFIGKVVNNSIQGDQ